MLAIIDMTSGGSNGGARAAGRAAVALLALVVASGCLVVEEDYTGNPDGPRVALLGDSISYGAVDEIHAALDPTHQVRIHAVTGITFAGSQERAVEFGATDPDVVVVELGTNDVWTNVPLATITMDLTTLLGEFPAACVVMSTVNEHTQNAVSGDGIVYDNAAAHDLNEVIRAQATNLVEWDVAANADAARYLDAGTIHPTPDGEALLAALVQEQVEACAA